VLRRAFAAVAATGLLGFAVAPSACQEQTCTLLACGDVHAILEAHVMVPTATFLAAKTTVCWNGACSALVTTDDAGKSAAVSLDPLGALSGTASVSTEPSGATLLNVALRFFTRASDGSLAYTRQANGDHYRVTVVDAQGKTLFDVDRAAIYEEYYPNGPDCDPDPCRRVSLDFSPA
jgi:hypothetical protein